VGKWHQINRALKMGQVFVHFTVSQHGLSVEFFVVDGISPPILQTICCYAEKMVLSLLFTIMEINPNMTFNLFAWISNVPLIQLAEGARALRGFLFYATISIREPDSFNQLIMNVRGACSDCTMRPHSTHTLIYTRTHTHSNRRRHIDHNTNLMTN